MARAMNFDAEWDTNSLKVLYQRLGHVPKEASNAVRKALRVNVNELRTLIRAEMPVVGGSVKHRHSWSHAEGPSRKSKSARRGGMKAAVKSKVSAEYAAVYGGGLPYYVANEFGGGAKFVNRAGHKQYIPIRERSPSLKSLGLYDQYGGQQGAAGWFFYPTTAKHLPRIQQSAVKAAEQAVRQSLSGRIGT